MLKDIQIIRVAAAITTITLLITQTVGLSHDIAAFLMGMGCGLSLVGAGKRFVESFCRLG